MSEPATFKIACASCLGHIEFPKELHGQTIPCPHCGLTAALRVPGYIEPAPEKMSYPAMPLAQNVPENFHYRETPAQSGRVQAIELTSKKWKMQKLFAGLVLFVGIGFVGLGAIFTSSLLFILGGAMCMAGIIWAIYASLGAWWNHE